MDVLNRTARALSKLMLYVPRRSALNSQPTVHLNLQFAFLQYDLHTAFAGQELDPDNTEESEEEQRGP